ncbi:hypothetical protein [Kushneria konosiri]|uniref:Outer membrane protein beta-barrel domain-containing protein n=1 Tax=Kushneria konosiri TaxID=698828 RepID=A0A2Z2H5Z2_9GAMM|nr:hypothetical protein [Kushneria konosiri]ARS52256.1 hypothetical protein B9G99_04650 [Kushneria konosiri]
MRRIATAVITGSLLLVTSAAANAEEHWSVAGTAGTTGLGANVSWRFHDHFALTAGYSGYNYDDLDQSVNDVDYEGEVDINVYSLKLDVYPWVNSGFFLSAGAVRPDIRINAIGRASVDFQGEDITIPRDFGYLDGKAELSDGVEPYLGIGWRNSSRQGLGFYAEAGAFLIDPSVSVNARGPITNSPLAPAARSYASDAEDDALDELNKYNIYPVAVIGIEYTF